MKKLRLGIAGLGRAFTLSAPAFRDPRIEVVAAADPRVEARAKFADEYHGRAYATVEELCADRDVDVVYVATPHEFHAQHTRFAASAGKHVLCEKPMALTLEDCRSMIDAAQQAGVRLVVGHSHSFDLPIARTAELAKAYGPVRMITALDYTDWVYRPRRPEELAAALSPLMQHCIEQFSPERCMFESNFPVDKISYSYNVVYNAFKRLSKGYSAAERAALFHDTAARVYRINQ